MFDILFSLVCLLLISINFFGVIILLFKIIGRKLKLKSLFIKLLIALCLCPASVFASSWTDSEFEVMVDKFESYSKERETYTSIYEFPKYASRISHFYGEEELTEEQNEILLSIYNEENASIASKIGIEVSELEFFYKRYYQSLSNRPLSAFDEISGGEVIQRHLIICDSPWCKDDGIDTWKMNWLLHTAGTGAATGDSVYVVFRNSQDQVIDSPESGYWRLFTYKWIKVPCGRCVPN